MLTVATKVVIQVHYFSNLTDWFLGKFKKVAKTTRVFFCIDHTISRRDRFGKDSSRTFQDFGGLGHHFKYRRQLVVVWIVRVS